ncbi:hypothetical protein GYMLUDRAFT_253230 [Collybiopsis luxurians FD-317 M1]|uniref:Uncharacterized protein n=1 Tax=Collybiopsis luxurians FD-317 M1 TaxID=944289 RepID=A0A0D0BXD0_9AGAR|nr:hypothetical protein GYMLUDRAFT_253230 [Collybiopsis luxurians FD-317 M1]
MSIFTIIALTSIIPISFLHSNSDSLPSPPFLLLSSSSPFHPVFALSYSASPHPYPTPLHLHPAPPHFYPYSYPASSHFDFVPLHSHPAPFHPPHPYLHPALPHLGHLR